MKKIILLFFCYFSTPAFSQNVTIPDANFKAALLANPSINTNSDAEIQVSEATAYTGAINVTSKNISNLTGIEAFTAATSLDCSYNSLASVNVSQNTTLKSLSCNNNQLTTLNVSSNTALTLLDCSVNQLAALNVSSNTGLTILGCNNNQLTSLNISSNTALTNLVCGFNQLAVLTTTANTALTSIDCGNNNLIGLNVAFNTALVTLACYNNSLTALSVSGLNSIKYLNCQQNQIISLDVSGNATLKEIRCYNNKLTNLNMQNGNNVNFTAFSATNNPSLTCIQVDNVAFMNTNWPTAKDPTAVYNVNCIAGIAEAKNNTGWIMIYPNPSSGIFKLDRSGHSDEKICVYDPLGNCVWEKDQKNISDFEIDLSSQSKGIYFMQVQSGVEKIIKKIVVQ